MHICIFRNFEISFNECLEFFLTSDIKLLIPLWCYNRNINCRLNKIFQHWLMNSISVANYTHLIYIFSLLCDTLCNEVLLLLFLRYFNSLMLPVLFHLLYFNSLILMQGIRGVWIKLPIELSHLVQPAVQANFLYCHS